MSFSKEDYIKLKQRATELERGLEEARFQLRTADALLKPMAKVADSSDHFDHDNQKSICSWRIGGERTYGPTVGDCRAAREFVRARLPALSSAKGGSDE